MNKIIRLERKNVLFFSGNSESLTEDGYSQVISVLQLVRSCSTQCPLVAALFMDELANTVQYGKICSKVEVT